MTTERIGTNDENCRIIAALRLPGLPVLDLGCGDAQCTHMMEDVTLVDSVPRPTNPPGVHLLDIRNPRTLFPGKHFGTVYLLDAIEHLHKDEGLRVISELEDFCQRIVIFTPTGALWVGEQHSNHPGDLEHPWAHKSGWTPSEFQMLGFTTWEWPQFHTFCGAFFAWKDTSGDQPTAAQVAQEARIDD